MLVSGLSRAGLAGCLALGAAGLVFSAGAGLLLRSYENEAVAERFAGLTRQYARALDAEVATGQHDAAAAAALYHAMGEVEREAFRRFVTPILEASPGLLSLQWILRIPGASRAAYEERARRDGIADFRLGEFDPQGRIVPAAERPEYLALYLVEPFASNRAVVGADMGSSPPRRAALDAARDAGRAVATPPIGLVQGGRGFITHFPLYKAGMPLATTEQRRAALAGFSNGVFRVDQIATRAAQGLVEAGLEVFLFDAGVPAERQFLHAVTPAGSPPVDTARGADAVRDGIWHEARVDVAGRSWLVIGRPSAAALTAERARMPWLLAAGGIALTLFGVFVLGWRDRLRTGAAIASARAEAERREIERRALAQREEDARAAEVQRRRMLEELATAFESSVREVAGVVTTSAGEMQAGSVDMSALAGETARQAEAVDAASRQVAANVDSVAGTADALSASTTAVSDRVRDARTVSTDAVQQASATEAAIRGLAEAARRIGEVVKLISDVASQTNLLALNATIEAARAGDAGKGFAVVAGEVKGLAGQTARATEEIEAQVGAIQSETERAVAAIAEIGRSVGAVNGMVGDIAEEMSRQDVNTRGIARDVAEARQETRTVLDGIAEVLAVARRSGGSADDVMRAADGLARQSERLRAEVEGFTARLRAAG